MHIYIYGFCLKHFILAVWWKWSCKSFILPFLSVRVVLFPSFVVVVEGGGFRGRENWWKWPISWLWKGKQLLPASNNVILFGVVLYLLITFVCQHERWSKLTISSLLGWEFDLTGFGFEKKSVSQSFYFLICLLNYDCTSVQWKVISV